MYRMFFEKFYCFLIMNVAIQLKNFITFVAMKLFTYTVGDILPMLMKMMKYISNELTAIKLKCESLFQKFLCLSAKNII